MPTYDDHQLLQAMDANGLWPNAGNQPASGFDPNLSGIYGPPANGSEPMRLLDFSQPVLSGDTSPSQSPPSGSGAPNSLIGIGILPPQGLSSSPQANAKASGPGPIAFVGATGSGNAPGGTSVAPGGTSVAPGGTSVAPGGTSVAPGGTSDVPVASGNPPDFSAQFDNSDLGVGQSPTSGYFGLGSQLIGMGYGLSSGYGLSPNGYGFPTTPEQQPSAAPLGATLDNSDLGVGQWPDSASYDSGGRIIGMGPQPNPLGLPPATRDRVNAGENAFAARAATARPAARPTSQSAPGQTPSVGVTPAPSDPLNPPPGWWKVKHSGLKNDPFTTPETIQQELRTIDTYRTDKGLRFANTPDGQAYHKILNDRLYAMQHGIPIPGIPQQSSTPLNDSTAVYSEEGDSPGKAQYVHRSTKPTSGPAHHTRENPSPQMRQVLARHQLDQNVARMKKDVDYHNSALGHISDAASLFTNPGGPHYWQDVGKVFEG